jgi:hypothetical protein
VLVQTAAYEDEKKALTGELEKARKQVDLQQANLNRMYRREAKKA